MKKSILWIINFFFLTSFVLVSCEETDGVPDPYTNWEERNQAYIDSIAAVAKANPDKWKIIHTYKSVASLPDLDANVNVNDYVYCKVLEEGTGTMKPVFTDFVSTHYRGQLIPLYNGTKVVFDQSFSYRKNIFKTLASENPKVEIHKQNLAKMERYLADLEKQFQNPKFWYSELQIVGIAQKEGGK